MSQPKPLDVDSSSALKVGDTSGYTQRHDDEHQHLPKFALAQLYGDDGTPVLAGAHAMIKAYAALHSSITNQLRDMDRELRSGARDAFSALIVLENTVLPQCRDGNFSQTARLIEIVLHRQRMNVTSDVTTDLFHILLKAMDEADAMKFFPVAEDATKYFTAPNLFGDKIALALPNAQDDLAEAGKCYALGRSTACVLHLMRALEGALLALAKVLANALSVQLKYELTDTMGQIATKIDDFATNKMPRTTAAEIIFQKKVNAIAVQFQTITKGLRNPAMHTGEFFSQEEAGQALAGARFLMNDLADII